MKTLLALFLLGVSFQAYSQTRTITARILDSQTKKPVSNAVIASADSILIYSNHLGYFQKTITDETKVMISHNGYVTSEILIPEQNSFVILLDRYYTDLGLLVLNREESKVDFQIDSDTRSIDSALIYKGNWQTLFEDLHERIVTFAGYVDSIKFTIDAHFTVTATGLIEEVTIVDEFLPQSEQVKDDIKSSIESLVYWPSSQTPKYSHFFRVKITNKEQISQEQIFMVVEEAARPINGMNGFYEYVIKKLQYPQEARRYGIEGKVFVQFIVEKNGELSNVRVIKGIGYGCDEEAVRIIQNSPGWIPGRQRGKPIRQQYVIPLNFSLASAKRK